MNLAELNGIGYEFDKATQSFIVKAGKGNVNKGTDLSKIKIDPKIKVHFDYLTRTIENNYDMSHITLCGYSNKLLKNLRYSPYGQRPNAVHFNTLAQDSPDHGAPFTCNYLKKLIDGIVAKVGVYSFSILSEQKNESFMYSVAKTTINDYFAKFTRDYSIDDFITKSFLESCLMAQTYSWINPFTNKFEKLNYWEVGVYDSEFRFGHQDAQALRHLCIRRYDFPKTKLKDYIALEDKLNPQIESILLSEKDSVVLSIFIDKSNNKLYAWADDIAICEKDYTLQKIYLNWMSFDVQVYEGMGTSLFSMLFPSQLALNDLYKNKSNRIKEYKGPVLVVQSDEDLVIDNVTNQSGGVLKIQGGGRDAANYLTTLQTTPLDPALAAEAEGIKKDMEAVSNSAELSIDLENYRNAGQIIAIKQVQDESFSPQIAMISYYLQSIVYDWIKFNAEIDPDGLLFSEKDRYPITWKEVNKMVSTMEILIKPGHKTAFDDGEAPQEMDPVVIQYNSCYKYITDILTKKVSLDDPIPNNLLLTNLGDLIVLRIQSLYQADDFEYVKILESLLFKLFIKRYEVDPSMSQFFEGNMVLDPTAAPAEEESK